MVAVPVSWQMGSSPLGGDLGVAQEGQGHALVVGGGLRVARILATCSLCSGRRRKETSRIASLATRSSADGSTLRISLPSKVVDRDALLRDEAVAGLVLRERERVLVLEVGGGHDPEGKQNSRDPATVAKRKGRDPPRQWPRPMRPSDAAGVRPTSASRPS